MDLGIPSSTYRRSVQRPRVTLHVFARATDRPNPDDTCQTKKSSYLRQMSHSYACACQCFRVPGLPGEETISFSAAASFAGSRDPAYGGQGLPSNLPAWHERVCGAVAVAIVVGRFAPCASEVELQRPWTAPGKSKPPSDAWLGVAAREPQSRLGRRGQPVA